MPQHQAYYPEMHGYYYFRPYHWSHLEDHQQFVTSFGGDSRNPYDNELFQRVYEEFISEAPVTPHNDAAPSISPR